MFNNLTDPPISFFITLAASLLEHLKMNQYSVINFIDCHL